MKTIKIIFMCVLVCLSLCSCSDEDIDYFFGDSKQDTEEISGDEKSTNNEENENSPVFYSTNDYETAKKGNTGVFSYSNKGNSYDVYWIINFDEGYVDYFTDGNGESTCDRVKIESGDLNDKMTVTWNIDGDKESWYLHFKYKEHPETLIVNDHTGTSIKFSTTDLDEAISIRDTKTIKEYY